MESYDRNECIKEVLQDLQEDTALLHLVISGIQPSLDHLTHTCLLRLMDYLKQHVNDICVLCNK